MLQVASLSRVSSDAPSSATSRPVPYTCAMVARITVGKGMMASEPAGQHYDVVVIEGPMRLFWSVVAKGIRLDESGLTWIVRSQGQERRRAYRDIRAIHLQILGIRSNLAICRISFDGGLLLQIHSTARNERYRQFVEDLHRRLHSEGIDAIEFRAGSTPRRHTLFLGTVIVMLALFVLLPIGVAVWRGEWGPLKVALGGGAFTLFFAMLMWRRQPVTYTPDRVPQKFFP